MTNVEIFYFRNFLIFQIHSFQHFRGLISGSWMCRSPNRGFRCSQGVPGSWPACSCWRTSGGRKSGIARPRGLRIWSPAPH